MNIKKLFDWIEICLYKTVFYFIKRNSILNIHSDEDRTISVTIFSFFFIQKKPTHLFFLL